VNYRHIFHAGNAADVFKHLVLVQLLQRISTKDTGYCVIDTHSGSGLYRLGRDGEFQSGIGKLWTKRDEWPEFGTYLSAVAQYNRDGLGVYPGSSILIADRLRAQDRAVLIEKNPVEFDGLRRHVGDRRGVALHLADGFAMLGAVVPPKENRGLVFIDPPFEDPDDFGATVQAIRNGLSRWRNGIFAAWYPIKQPKLVAKFREQIGALGAPAYVAELLTLPDDVPNRLNGSGMLIVNSPYQLDAWMMTNLPALAEFLAPDSAQGRFRITPLG